MGERVAYIRVSSVGQNLDVQREKAIAAGVAPENIFEEKKSGTNTNRPALKEALRFVRKGDTFIVSRIDRLARSLADLLAIVKELTDKGVSLHVLDQSIDTSNPAGRAMLQMLGIFAEFEAAIRAERQVDGIASAKDKGVKFGRKLLLTDAKIAEIAQMRRDGLMIKDIIAKTGLKKATVYKALGQATTGEVA
ncbi:recombinase family protein [Shinella zoogloeoides]|uniref:Recombinase family protein n=1 Tax=Shinella zoogloeoides TaxID=352475 RepID=A0A6N8TFB9_SHIZO|nr:recombinase family protein [Shinella zoogloeoides]MXO01331.1 recombinase family protein [Shinella zoogloeoides]UEX81572.1 recombinase family protein [Shinella zoogloeoides]